jgi:hypothetical protein
VGLRPNILQANTEIAKPNTKSQKKKKNPIIYRYFEKEPKICKINFTYDPQIPDPNGEAGSAGRTQGREGHCHQQEEQVQEEESRVNESLRRR